MSLASGPFTPQVGGGQADMRSASSSASAMSGISGRFSTKQELIMGALSVWSINLEEVEMGKELGKGAFGKVSSCAAEEQMCRAISWPS